MSAISRLHLTCALGAIVLAGLAYGAAGPASRPKVPDYRVSGPFSHDNLTVFFLHGEDQIKGRKLLTLDEALQAKKVIVHETRNVQELAIENVSTQEVFVQAGDIVKGGQQDRVIASDLIVPPRSGKMPLPSFCVEQGRWSKRGGENEKAFGRSNRNLVGNDLKLAARKASSQGQVWRSVSYAQMRLAQQLKAEVKDSGASTSLQLTLENKKLLEAVDSYVKKLEKSLGNERDAIGYAVAINGKITSADVYANADLFRKLWPKLLKCSAIEAVTDRKTGTRVEPVKCDAVKTFLAEVQKGERSEKGLISNLKELQKETEGCILFETRCKSEVIRRSYLKK